MRWLQLFVQNHDYQKHAVLHLIFFEKMDWNSKIIYVHTVSTFKGSNIISLQCCRCSDLCNTVSYNTWVFLGEQVYANNKKKIIFSSVVLTYHWKVYQGFWNIYIRQLRWQVNIVFSFERFASSSPSMVQSLEETCHFCALGLQNHIRMTQVNIQDMLQWLPKVWNLGDCCS